MNCRADVPPRTSIAVAEPSVRKSARSPRPSGLTTSMSTPPRPNRWATLSELAPPEGSPRPIIDRPSLVPIVTQVIAGRSGGHVGENGLMSRAPVRSTLAMFRVTRTRLCSIAVAASRPSTTGTGSCCEIIAQRSPISIVTGRIRSP